MRSLAEENSKRIGDLLTDSGKFAILAAIVTANISSVAPDIKTILLVLVIGIVFLITGFWAYAISKQKEKQRMEKELASAHSRKHKLRVLRDTNFVIEVQQPSDHT